MANPNEDPKSDGLEILSIGALYTGPWDKKYWSSSRGKDRYPYPVGYEALRTHKGLPYKMEIHEGSKGPIFKITSNDKQHSSGDTPDRAWESFQKKSSRVKLWPGKRSFGKIDGIEFFGFKNALVQRLLRELVATVDDAYDRSSVFTNCNEASLKGHDVGSPLTHEHPDLRLYLEKTTATGKRSRACRGRDINSACESGHNGCQPPHQGENGKVPYSEPGKADVYKPLVTCAASDYHVHGALQVIPNIELVENVSLSANGLPLNTNEVPADPKAEPCLIQVQSELPSMDTSASAGVFGLDMPQDEKLEEILNVAEPDKLCIQVQGFGLPVATEEGNQKVQVSPDLLEPRPPVPRDAEVNHYGDLYAPDTLDTQQDAPVFGSHGGEQAILRNEAVAGLLFCEETVMESCSEAGSHYLSGNSEKSEFDFSEEDIAQTMLKILLPRTVPLLKYASRKRRKKTKPPADFSCVSKLENNSTGANQSADVKCPAEFLRCSGSDEQLKVHVPSAFNNLGRSMMEYHRYIVPDSLDDDQYEGHVAHELPPSADNAETLIANMQKKYEPDKKESSPVLDANELCSHQNETSGSKEFFTHEELHKKIDEMSQNECVFAVFSPLSVPLELVAASEEQCLNADGCFKPIENCSKNTDLQIMPDCKGLRFIPVPGKQQLSPMYTHLKMGNGDAHLSENIICRNTGDNCVTEISAFGDNVNSKASFIGGRLEAQSSSLQNDNVEDALAQNCVLQDQVLSVTFNSNDIQSIDGCNFHARPSEACLEKGKTEHLQSDSVYQSTDLGRGSSHRCASNIKEDDTQIHSSCVEERDLNDEIEGTMKLIGCYSHPMRISSVILTRFSHEIYICVSCGLLEERKRDLFLYKLSTDGPSLGRPCMVGHTSMSLPALKDEFGREVAIDKSGLEFTPDARALVLADSIRMPYCREKDLHCLCPQCKSCCFEENAVKIVRVKLGYISLLVKLNTIFPIHCVLVCEPEHLIAVDESGRIYIWIMNSIWSEQTEAYVIQSYEFLPSRIVELKKIPKSASMVVGHNGYGEFSLWDIIKRTVVSRFSAPASSVFNFLPVSLFSWPSKGFLHDLLEGYMRKFEEATMLWFSRNSERNISCPMEGEDIAVWLLICTSSDSRAQSACYSSNYHSDSDGCWRLGLLIKDMVILGASLYSSTTAIGMSSGSGIIGTDVGQVYMWKLATGSKVEALQDLEGNRVLHIATDDSTSSAVAIAGEGGKLCVYLHT